jgi:flagellar hook-associated protein FlgK
VKEEKAMKTWIFGALALAMTVSTSAAMACPVGTNGEVQQRPRPIQNVSFQASELFERAQQLETAASSRDRQAVAFERDAENLANRARILRNQAQNVSSTDRSSILALADELTSRASSSRSQASEERAQASELRVQARSMRERAVQLVRVGNGGGGWRGRPLPPTSKTAETSI